MKTGRARKAFCSPAFPPLPPPGASFPFCVRDESQGRKCVGAVWEPSDWQPLSPPSSALSPIPPSPHAPPHSLLSLVLSTAAWLSFLGPSPGLPSFPNLLLHLISMCPFSPFSFPFLYLLTSSRSRSKYLFLQEALLGPQPSCPCVLFPPRDVFLLWVPLLAW